MWNILPYESWPEQSQSDPRDPGSNLSKMMSRSTQIKHSWANIFGFISLNNMNMKCMCENFNKSNFNNFQHSTNGRSNVCSLYSLYCLSCASVYLGSGSGQQNTLFSYTLLSYWTVLLHSNISPYCRVTHFCCTVWFSHTHLMHSYTFMYCTILFSHMYRVPFIIQEEHINKQNKKKIPTQLINKIIFILDFMPSRKHRRC